MGNCNGDDGEDTFDDSIEDGDDGCIYVIVDALFPPEAVRVLISIMTMRVEFKVNSVMDGGDDGSLFSPEFGLPSSLKIANQRQKSLPHLRRKLLNFDQDLIIKFSP